jgi:hypothetical protein
MYNKQLKNIAHTTYWDITYFRHTLSHYCRASRWSCVEGRGVDSRPVGYGDAIRHGQEEVSPRTNPDGGYPYLGSCINVYLEHYRALKSQIPHRIWQQICDINM